MLARHGFRYDSSLMDADRPYLLCRGRRSATLVELPIHWSLDDWEPYVYLPDLSGSGVIASPAEVVARWTLELDALVADGGLFILTNHPFVSGRPSRAAGLETLIEHAQSIDGLWIATCDEIARWVETLGLEPVDDQRPAGTDPLGHEKTPPDVCRAGSGADECRTSSRRNGARRASLQDPVERPGDDEADRRRRCRRRRGCWRSKPDEQGLVR